ncbi:hypothetical protein ANANG_G00162180 [Anguilla anguilla]|uniref:Uncharacterized protein n=1 Tax=Anguilla anguilla TaxID=7936 RepID=A0A9D3MBS0_ANGAN|nr:hypothetical protein ANANG_G00162180 [Anguilla anguilla]
MTLADHISVRTGPSGAEGPLGAGEGPSLTEHLFRSTSSPRILPGTRTAPRRRPPPPPPPEHSRARPRGPERPARARCCPAATARSQGQPPQAQAPHHPTVQQGVARKRLRQAPSEARQVPGARRGLESYEPISPQSYPASTSRRPCCSRLRDGRPSTRSRGRRRRPCVSRVRHAASGNAERHARDSAAPPFSRHRNDSRSPGSVSYQPSFFTRLENTSPMVKSKKQEIFRKLNSSGGGDSDVASAQPGTEIFNLPAVTSSIPLQPADHAHAEQHAALLHALRPPSLQAQQGGALPGPRVGAREPLLSEQYETLSDSDDWSHLGPGEEEAPAPGPAPSRPHLPATLTLTVTSLRRPDGRPGGGS